MSIIHCFKDPIPIIITFQQIKTYKYAQIPASWPAVFLNNGTFWMREKEQQSSAFHIDQKQIL